MRDFIMRDFYYEKLIKVIFYEGDIVDYGEILL